MIKSFVELNLLNDGDYECLELVEFPAKVIGVPYYLRGKLIGYDVPLMVLSGLDNFTRPSYKDLKFGGESGLPIASLFFSTRRGEVEAIKPV